MKQVQRLLWALSLVAAGVVAYLLLQPATAIRPAVDVPDPRVSAYPLPPRGSAAPAAGALAPEFSLPLIRLAPSQRRPPALRGGRIALSQFRGRVVLLNFFASWCAPCAAEVPELEKVSQRLGDRAVILGVAVLDEFEEAEAFLRRHRVTYPAVFDGSNRTMDLYGVTGLPTSIFIAADGRLVSRFTGPFLGPEGTAELRRRLRQAGAD